MQSDGHAGRDAREEGSRAGRGLRAELIFRPVAFAMLVAALIAAPAEARPWNVQTVSTHGVAFSRGVDVLPNGRAAVLLQRRSAGGNRLELRVGRGTRTLDIASRSFLSTQI